MNALLLQMHAVATALYDEVLDGEKQEVITEARQAISRFSGVVARAKAQDTPGAAYAWSKFVVELTARAASELRENAADSMVSVSAGQVLAALGHDSSMSLAHVLKIAVPLLVEQLENESSGVKACCRSVKLRLRVFCCLWTRLTEKSTSLAKHNRCVRTPQRLLTPW